MLCVAWIAVVPPCLDVCLVTRHVALVTKLSAAQLHGLMSTTCQCVSGQRGISCYGASEMLCLNECHLTMTVHRAKRHVFELPPAVSTRFSLGSTASSFRCLGRPFDDA